MNYKKNYKLFDPTLLPAISIVLFKTTVIFCAKLCEIFWKEL